MSEQTVKQSGFITPGHLAVFETEGVIADGGDADVNLAVAAVAASATAAANSAILAATYAITASNNPIFASVTIATAATISGATTYLQVQGYAAIGDDGAGLYKKVVSAPAHSGYFQSADGAYWELQGPVVTLENFGAKGDGSTDDHTAIVNAFSSHVTMGVRLVGCPGKTYKNSGAGIVQLFTGIDFDGRGCTFAFYSLTAANAGFNLTYSSLRTATTLASSCAVGDKNVIVAAANSAIVGDLLHIDATLAATSNRVQFSIPLTTVSGTTFTLEQAIPAGAALNSAIDANSFQAIVASSGGKFRNCTIDGLNSTNNAIFAMLVQGNIGGLVENIEFTNWYGAGRTSINGAGGPFFDSCYRITIRNIGLYKCGSLGQAAFIAEVTDSVVDGVSGRLNGFGPQFPQGAYNNISNINSADSAGRGIKVGGALSSNFSNLAITRAQENGLAITDGTSFCNFNNVVTIGNYGVALNENCIWFSDQYCKKNRLCNFLSIQQSGISGYEIDIGATDTDNQFSNGRVTDLTSTYVRDSSHTAIFENVNGVIARAHYAMALASGGNNNVPAPTTTDFAYITGPAGGFSITGIANGYDGRRFSAYNATANNMTISNQSGSSSVGNKIITLTGADVVLTGTSIAHFLFSNDQASWILTGTQG